MPSRNRPGEFELIAHLVRSLPRDPHVILGPGDDCAILKPSRRPLLFTIDSMVEEVHFRLEWGTPEKLGVKALAVNLSDLAAMGAAPRAFVVNLAVREGLDLRFFDRLYAGIKDAARAFRAALAGGNITRSQKLAITVALIGEAQGRVLRRDAGAAGDDIFVTGTIGDSAAGLRILSGKLRAEGRAKRFLIERHLCPTPRIKAGLALAKLNRRIAAIDISDGLLQDLGHILERSGVGAEIDAGAVPVSDAYREVMGGDLSLALGGGEDYELLFCLGSGETEHSLSRKLGVPVQRIGRMVKGRRAVLRGTGGVVLASVQGWDQLSSSPPSSR